MRGRLRRAMASTAGGSAADAVVGAVARLERRRSRPGTLAVLTYHRIATPDARPDLITSLRSTDPAGFAAQIDRLATGHRFVSIHDVLAWRRQGVDAPPRSVLVTFDDAYTDLAAHVWPILRARSIPAVAFVPTGFVDTGRSFWWDALHHALGSTDAETLPWRGGSIDLGAGTGRATLARRLRDEVKALPHDAAMAAVDALVAASGVTPTPAPVLGWDALRALHREGLDLAPHTRSHAFLDRVPESQARLEVEGSMADLQAEVGACPPVFAYPSGQWDDGARRAVAAAGIEVAMTTRRGVNAIPGDDWLTLDRINIGAATTPALLEAQLLRSLGPLVRRVDP